VINEEGSGVDGDEVDDEGRGTNVLEERMWPNLAWHWFQIRKYIMNYTIHIIHIFECISNLTILNVILNPKIHSALYNLEYMFMFWIVQFGMYFWTWKIIQDCIMWNTYLCSWLCNSNCSFRSRRTFWIVWNT